MNIYPLFAVCILIVGLYVIHKQSEQGKNYRESLERDMKRLSLQIGSRVVSKRGFNYEKVGIVVDYNLMNTVDIRYEDGSKESQVSLKDLDKA